MALVGFRAPALPVPPSEYSPQQQSELVRTLRLYFNLIDSLTPQQADAYTADEFIGGSFEGNKIQGGTLAGFGQGLEVPHALLMSDEDQDSAGITSENIVTINRVIFSDGINVEDGSKIVFAYSGQYLITARFQFANRGNDDQIFEIWAKNTGVNYPLSNTRFDILKRKSASVYSHVTANISGIFTVTGGEYLEFAWWSDGADMYIEHYAAGTSPARPEIPSVIITATFVSALPARFVPTLSDTLSIQGIAPSLAVTVTPSVLGLSIQGIAPTISIA